MNHEALSLSDEEEEYDDEDGDDSDDSVVSFPQGQPCWCFVCVCYFFKGCLVELAQPFLVRVKVVTFDID